MDTTAPAPLDQATRLMLEEEMRHLLAALSVPDSQVQSELDAAGRLWLVVDTPDANRLLIGPHGAHLEALQHVVHCIVRRRVPRSPAVVVDVGRYRRDHDDSLVALAESSAQQAEQTRQAIVLPPMSAYDRRVIHMALAEHSGVQTESQGQEPRRRLVIRPKL